MNRAGPTTLKQIAAATGVHTSTVSRALDPHKRHLVADDVAERIVHLAQSLGYQPNRVATSLRTGRSHLIGVLLPDIANPVFAPILSGIAEALASEGYAPIVADAGNDSSQQIAFVDNLLNQRVDGLILATVSRDDDVVGHNDMPLFDLISPPLTTIRIGHREMGRGAAKLLLKEIDNRDGTAQHVILQPELIVRASTAALRMPSEIGKR